MSDKKYDVIITSVDPSAELTLLSAKLGKALKKNPQQIEFSLNEIACLSGADFTIIQGIAENKAKQLQAYLAKQGLGSDIRAEISLEMMVEVSEYTCPACGHAQQPDPEGNDTCERCGVIGKKYAAVKRRKDILESERRRHQALQQMGQSELQKNAEKAEEERLREEARQKLGIAKKKTSSFALLGLATLIGIGAVAYLYQDQLFPTSVDVNSEQVTTNPASKQTKQAVLTISPKGGKITFSSPNTAGNSSPTESMNTAQLTVATKENTDDMSDAASQNIALQMHQQAGDGDLAVESDVKAKIVALGIEKPDSRTALLSMIGAKEADIDPQTIEQLKHSDPEIATIEDNHFKDLQAELKTILETNDYTQAFETTQQAKDNYQKAILLYQVIRSEIQNNEDMARTHYHIIHLSLLAKQEAEAVNQIRIQSLLSAAYALFGEKKTASLNLVMAIEKLHHIESNKTKVELLCELSRNQTAVANINQAREILKLAEKSATQLEHSQQAKAYADIVKQYAKALDFSTAMQLTSKISQPILLREALGIITNIQDEYMSISNPTV